MKLPAVVTCPACGQDVETVAGYEIPDDKPSFNCCPKCKNFLRFEVVKELLVTVEQAQ
jgi:hypothetical protein